MPKSFITLLLCLMASLFLHASATEVKAQFTVTHIMLELFDAEVPYDPSNTVQTEEQNSTFYQGGDQK